MKEIEEMLKAEIQNVEPMVMTAQDTHNFNSATKCCLRNGELGQDRVRDHDHLTGEYRGAAQRLMAKEGLDDAIQVWLSG